MSSLQHARIPAYGEEVRVYRNLHRAAWSVQVRVPGKGWRVAFHASNVVLGNATFEVNETGRQKVLRERKKNVHAFVRGRVVTLSWPRVTAHFSRPVTYNPFKAPTFVVASTFPPVPVSEAGGVWLPDNGPRVWATAE